MPRGYLKSITLKNFMCHNNLEVDFNKNINFIIGENGSGKSAIQTGVAVGLGGKALATNRASSLKDLIKADKNNASITIVMGNEGPNAFNPQLYGREIRVERHFTRTSSGYKLMSESGEVISTEKKELDRMVAQFDIQIQNPICMLHQDLARCFLNTSDPKKKFEFFMKATRFAHMENVQATLTENVNTLKESYTSKHRIILEIFQDVIKMKEKKTVIEEAKEMEKQQEKLQIELIWCRVREIETCLEEKQKERNLEVKSKEKLLKRLKDEDDSQYREELSKKRQEQNLRAASDRLNELHNQKKKVEGQIQEISKSLSNLAMYENTIVRIVEEINKRQNQFCQKPIGPLGHYIKVKDPKWTAAVENFLGFPLLSAFCVDNENDFEVLNNILKSVCQCNQPTIYCSQFLTQKHNIQEHETMSNEYMNLARMLVVDNPVVFNCLVDQVDVHTALLIPNNEEVYPLFEDENQVPKFCTVALTLTGDIFYPAPNYKIYSSWEEITHPRFLQQENQQDIIRSLKEELSKLNQDVASKQEEVRSAQKELRNEGYLVQEMETLRDELEQETRLSEGKIKQMKSQIQQIDRKLTEIDSEITELTKKLDQNMEEASQVCEPVSTRRNAADIQRDLNNVKQYLEKVLEETGGTVAAFEEHFLERLAKFDKAMNTLSTMNRIYKMLKSHLQRRQEQMQKCVEKEIASFKDLFQEFLEEQNLDGKLVFDLKAETLEFKVYKRDGSSKVRHMKAMDTASLSGGEKSFSNVCFIMLLWQNNDSPFFFLDEFDVFMDGINRQTVMEMLINYAELNEKQFVLLTPFNTSIKAKPNLSIHELKAPRD